MHRRALRSAQKHQTDWNAANEQNRLCGAIMNHINDIKSEEHGAPEIWGVFVSLEVKLFPEQMSRTTNWCQSFFCLFFETHQKNTNHDDTSSFFLTRRWTYGSFSSSCDDRNVFLSHGEFLWIIPPGILRPDWLRSVSTAQQHRPTDHWFWYYSHTFIRKHDELSVHKVMKV